MRVLVLLLSLFLAGAASAQSQSQQVPQATAVQNVEDQQQRAVTQPGNNAPFYREVRSGSAEYTTSSVKGPEAGVLIQSGGETWRQIRNGPAMFYGGWLLVVVIAAILGLYLWKGPVQLSEPLTGRRMRRFTPFEMTVHWSTAISFCLLGLSGLVMFFGKSALLPLIGYTLFGWLTYLCKNVHNFIAPLFIVSAAVMVVIWARDNIFRRYDWQWFRRAWAFFLKSEHIPSGRFNAGEKAWFWGGVLLLSIVMTWSGLVLLFPNFDQTRATLQVAWIWHVAAAMLYIAASLGHIYMGTIGVAHTYDNMRHGWTDETWAKEHHSIWYDEVKSGRRPSEALRAGGGIPAGAPHMKEKA
jgi:formate dehydrogenase subunit gamma